tara:strand:- start:773 stop:946 length:174 start_codon:yes stop_codon:yes gene_type:complete
MDSIVEFVNDFVIVKESYSDKPYSVSKKFNIDRDYPCYNFSNYEEAINFIQEVEENE